MVETEGYKLAKVPGLGLNPTAIAALAKAIDLAIANAVEAEREACAKLAQNACLSPPDGGSPTPDEAELCDYLAKMIRARNNGDGL